MQAPTTKCLMLLELDMEKKKRTYNRLYWPFLFNALRQYSFRNKFIQWALACITTHGFNSYQ